MLLTLRAAVRIFDQPPETLDKLGRRHDSDGARISEEQHVTPNSREIARNLSSEALQSAHGLVSQLKKLSIALRRATANEYNVQAAIRRDTDKDGNDVGKDDETWASQIVKYRFPGPVGGLPGITNELKQTLSTGISFRMRRFRDWRRHYEKRLERERAVAEQLAREPGQAEQREEQEPTDDEDYQGDEGAEPGEMTTASGGPTNSQLSGGGVHPSLAVSKRSFASSKFEAPKSSSQSTAVSKSVRSMIAGVYMDWPRPPRDSSSTGQVNCPYCFDLLDEGEICSKTRWRYVHITVPNIQLLGNIVDELTPGTKKHLKKDLEPYSCLYTECGTKLLKMFDSEAKWVSHIQVAHSPGGTWVCRMMPHKDSNLNSKRPWRRGGAEH